MAKIRMEFERGGVIEGTLFEDRAPKTCKAFLEALPVEHAIGHAMWAGEEIARRVRTQGWETVRLTKA